MSTRGSDSPAFPTMQYDHGGENDGMTLRDYFAAKAMQGFCSGDALVGAVSTAVQKSVADISYAMADAMLEARK